MQCWKAIEECPKFLIQNAVPGCFQHCAKPGIDASVFFREFEEMLCLIVCPQHLLQLRHGHTVTIFERVLKQRRCLRSWKLVAISCDDYVQACEGPHISAGSELPRQLGADGVLWMFFERCQTFSCGSAALIID